MKKRFIYICMFASLLTFSSCNEALDVAPDGRLSLDEVFQDPDLTKAYFSTCFDYLPKKSLRYHFCKAQLSKGRQVQHEEPVKAVKRFLLGISSRSDRSVRRCRRCVHSY